MAAKSSRDQGNWHVYIVRCNDKSLYTGITTDLSRRLDEHNNSPRGATYTRSRRPVTLVYSDTAINRSAACRREREIKNLTKLAKEQLLLA
ncbi:MAG: GIY-YIG nuclease family protein [Granulosicoccus sp.]